MINTILLLSVMALVLSALLLYAYRPLALKANLLDVPNERSSHTVPTIRGAGICFAATFVCLTAVYSVLGHLSSSITYPILLGSFVVCAIGFADDYLNLKPLLRLFVQLLTSVCTLVFLTYEAKTDFIVTFLPIQSFELSLIFGILFISWFINLFNFMDGIDGIAASQSTIVSILSATITYYNGHYELSICYFLLALSLLPFLKLNWYPAKVFMGDSGAYFLGFIFALTAIYGKLFYQHSLLLHIILLGAFISDATTTLLVRLARGQKVWRAHKSHGFQKLLQKYSWSQKKISIFYCTITCFWFFPIALLTYELPSYSFLLCVLAYAPFIFFLFTLTVGFDEKSNT